MTESATPAQLVRQAFWPFIRRFMWAAAYFAAVFIVGAIGYVLIERWGWFDSIYMAVTTVTSVGFMEIRPLSPAGRLFTMGLIALGLMGLGVWWALTTALIVELDLIGLFRRRKMMRESSGRISPSWPGPTTRRPCRSSTGRARITPSRPT
jgi:hypothetical protein